MHLQQVQTTNEFSNSKEQRMNLQQVTKIQWICNK